MADHDVVETEHRQSWKTGDNQRRSADFRRRSAEILKRSTSIPQANRSADL